MKIFSKIGAAIDYHFRMALRDFVEIETALDQSTLVTSNGALVTVLRVEGSRVITSEKHAFYVSTSLSNALATFMNSPGHVVQAGYLSDPDRGAEYIDTMMVQVERTAKLLGLEMPDIFSERRRFLPTYIRWEEVYVALWTTVNCLHKSEMEAAKDEFLTASQGYPSAPNAQSPFKANDLLIPRHIAFVRAFLAAAKEQKLVVGRMHRDDAIRAIAGFATLSDVRSFKPRFPGDVLLSREPDYGDKSASALLWPKLQDQLFNHDDVEQVTRTTVRINDRIFGSMDMMLGPVETQPFQTLLNKFKDEGASIPWRYSMLIEGGGASAFGMKKLFATLLAFSNSENKLLKNAIENLRSMNQQDKVPLVKLRVSLATWAPADDAKLLQRRMAILARSFESWGQIQASMNNPDDPLEGLLSSTIGLHKKSTAPVNVAPIGDAMMMMPMTRPAAIMERGSALFRTPDGKGIAYEPGTGLQTTWTDVYSAPPGSGKSVLLNTTNMAFLLSSRVVAGNAKPKLPRLSIIDIGKSSEGLISLIREALPPQRRHEAIFVRLRNTVDYAINPFDTLVGCRRPLTEHREFLVNILSIVMTPEGRGQPYDGMRDLIGFVVDEVYKIMDPDEKNGRAKKYEPGVDFEVDAAIARYNLDMTGKIYWWDVVDAFMERQLPHEAGMAQRYAVPVLDDCISAAREQHIVDLFEKVKIETGENLIEALSRAVQSAVREFKIIGHPTRFDLSGARIVSIDLADVVPPTGHFPKQTSLMYMLARHASAGDFYLHKDNLKEIDERYRAYHAERIRDLLENPKRLCMDELHRAKDSVPFMKQLGLDSRTARKSFVQMAFVSQQIADFPDDILDNATTKIIIGCDGENDFANIVKKLAPSQMAQGVIKSRLHGPGPGGAPFVAILNMKDGVYEQYLVNTLGPVEIWAYSTSPTDVQLRSRLYDRLGPVRARQRLAALFPDGSAALEVKKRVDAMVDQGSSRDEADGSVLDRLEAEIVNCTGIAAILRGTGNMETDITFYDWCLSLSDEIRQANLPIELLQEMYNEGLPASAVTDAAISHRMELRADNADPFRRKLEDAA